METHEKTFEVEGVKLSEKAISEIYFLQNYARKGDGKMGHAWTNKAIKETDEFIDQNIQFVINLSKEDPKRNENMLSVLWCLADYRKLLNTLQSPD